MGKYNMNIVGGFTLLEVLVVIALTGVLLSFGFVALPRDHFSVQQAAQQAARDVQLARFEAISRSAYVGVRPLQTSLPSGNDYAGNGYIVFVDEPPRNHMFDQGETVLKSVDFTGETAAQLYDASTTSTFTYDVVFDPRGISRGNSRWQITSPDRKYDQWICINMHGNARIKPDLASC